MKRAISFVLALTMLLSIMSAASVTAFAADEAKKAIIVQRSDVNDGKITFSVSLAAGLKELNGVVLQAEFDPSVLKINDSSSPEMNESGDSELVPGLYQYDMEENSDDTYCVAYLNQSGLNTSSAKKIFNITFDIIDDSRPATSVSFTCLELLTDDEIVNDIKVTDESQQFASFNFLTLQPVNLIGAEYRETGINIIWEPSAGANEYNIYRKTASTEWELLDTVSSSYSEYFDAGVSGGESYSYTVSAVNGSGEGAYDYAGMSCTFIVKPVLTKVSNAQSGVLVEWNAVTGATSYCIKRKAADSDVWSKLATVPASAGTEFTDTAVLSKSGYSYAVCALSGTTVTGDSNSLDVFYLAAPVVTAVSNNGSAVKLEWIDSENATGYIVYRRLINETSYTKLGEVTGSTAFTDNTAFTAQRYVYGVQSVFAEGKSGIAESKPFIKVASVVNVTAETAQGGVLIKWNTAENVDGYCVYRRLSTTTKWSLLIKVDYSVNEYTDTTVQGNKEYEYAVSAFALEAEGDMEAAASSVYYLATPQIVSMFNKENGIQLTWSPSAGCSYYEIYRKDVEGTGGFAFVQAINTASVVTFTDGGVVDGKSYIYAVKACSAKGSSLLSGESKSFTRISPPVMKTPSVTKTGITLSWSEVGFADGYRLYRKTTGSWALLTTVSPSSICTYTDKTTKTGIQYYYTVSAFSGEFESELGSADGTVRVSTVPATASITLTNDITGFTVKWAAVSGAIKYGVYRRASGTTEWTALYTTSDAKTLTYTDKSASSGTKYQYLIRSYASSISFADAQSAYAVYAACPVVTAANTFSGVKVSWKSIGGATKYRVYRKLSTAKSWSKLKDVNASTLSYIDSSAKNGKKYLYTVSSYVGSVKSAYKAVTLECLTSPKLSSISNTTAGVALKWNKITGATKYVLYRKLSSATSWTRIAVVNTLSYTDKTAVSGKTCKYTVRAYNGVYSGYSGSGKSILFLSSPKLVSAVSARSGITFKWGKVTGATGYYIYRKTGSGSWVRIATVKKNATVSYLDKTAKKGTTYTYTARAYYSSYKSSYYSGVSCKDKY